MVEVPKDFRTLRAEVFDIKDSARPGNSPKLSKLQSEPAEQPPLREGPDKSSIRREQQSRILSAEVTRDTATKSHSASNRTPAESQDPQFELKYVIAREREAIVLRRKELFTTKDPSSEDGEAPRIKLPKCPQLDPGKLEEDCVGLAFSGGGIRSAAFSTGVVQALAVAGVLRRMDYMSTVSGGGYTGAAVTSTMVQSEGNFVFASVPSPGSKMPEEIADTPQLGHIRDYSNYLVPHGNWDIVRSLAVVVRGLAANVLLILPFILLLAAVTIFCAPTKDRLTVPNFFGLSIAPFAPQTAFGAGILGLCGMGLLYVGWALWRSRQSLSDTAENETWPGVILLIALAILVLNFEPYALSRIFETADGSRINYASWTSALLAPLIAIVTVFKDKIVPFLERDQSSSTWTDITKVLGAKLLIWAAAAALPLVLWAFYMTLCYWGVVDGCEIARRPGWLTYLSSFFGKPNGYDAAAVYLIISIVLFLFASRLTPNANSLHQLYRDRLGQAFLCIDVSSAPPPPDGTCKGYGDTGKISNLDPTFAPYHLINSAVNLEGSRYLNQRGRNADFFLFSPLFVGSAATGYMPTLAYEKVCPKLDLASAIAISGAAISSNMGAQSIRPLAPTLALLNARLGYWIENPRYLLTADGKTTNTKPSNAFDCLYLFREMFGRLSEKSKKIYLTDGGHIENLGVYELLRRRCKLIIVVDAEADPDMTFGALIAVQRYARIDLGVRITLPWEAIQKMSLSQMGDNFGKNPAAAGPHVVLGTIDYGSYEEGLILYVKSSLSGDETDYVRDYARRSPTFPHETTGDQFFSEEQFEVYRALGFHIMQRALSGEDTICCEGSSARARITTSSLPLVVQLRTLIQL